MTSVLHVMSTLSLGGAERFAVGLAQIQRQEGVNAQVFNLGSDRDFLVQEIESQKIPLLNINSADARIKHYRRLCKIIGQFDVVHIHSPHTLRHLALVIPFFSHTRFIYTRHGLYPLKSIYWKMLHKFIRRFIHKATFVTQSGCDVFVKYHNWPKSKLQIIENGAFVPESYTISTEKPVRFGSVGRMIELKGQLILMEALKILASKSSVENDKVFALNFFGSGPLESRLSDIAKELPDNLVTFHGQEKNIDKIYENIDVLVVASESEGLSMVIIEAMARGIPVIATDVGGNPTLVKNAETGLLIPYGSATALAQAMQVVLGKPDLIKTYGVAARQLVVEKFSLLNTQRAYQVCYES